MKKIKNIIFVVIILIIWLFLFVYAVNKGEIASKKSVSQYIIINQFYCWKYMNSNWESLSYAVDEFNTSKELNWKKYDIYIDNVYYNTLDYVVKNGEEFYFDDDIQSYEISNEKIMFNKDSFLKLNDFNKSVVSTDDEKIINKILKKYNLPIENITVKDKYIIDDNKGSVYIISNYTGYYPFDSQNSFNLIFYRVNGINYLLIKNGYIEHINSYKLAFVVDAKNRFNNLIISASCEGGPCYWMYEYKNGKFINVID